MTNPCSTSRLRLPALVLTFALATSVVEAQRSDALLPTSPPERCEVAPGSPPASVLLDRAARLVLPADGQGKTLRLSVSVDVPLWEQSDRPYEPFLPSMTQFRSWLDLSTGNVGLTRLTAQDKARTPQLLLTRRGVYQMRDTTAFELPPTVAGAFPSRELNPWAVLIDWRAAPEQVRLVARCNYRGFPRLVLQRAEDRLYLTEADAHPIALVRTEPHYLWGQVRVEYLWNTWWGVTNGGGRYPVGAFRVIDGVTTQRAGVDAGAATLVMRDSVPSLADPSSTRAIPMPRMDVSDTVRVADGVWLLRAPAYTHGLAMFRDTVYLLDATTGEARSRADSAWIARLYPGKRAVVVVVTDVAWPHISGLRFWAARGATFVTHESNASFLRRVLDRRWTLAPDALEKGGKRAAAQIRTVRVSLTLAGGQVVLHALDAFSTEGAVAAWLPAAQFLWAGDYVQPTPISPYAADVKWVVARLGLQPRWLGAQHMPLTEWGKLP